MKKAIVTGANGFIGTALCKALSDYDVSVIAVVKDTNENIDNIKNIKGLSVVYCELNQFSKLDELIEDRDVDTFYHLAWVGSAGPNRGNDEVQIDNLKYTCDTVRAAKRINAHRFVFASSIMEFEIEALMADIRKPSINTLYSSAKLAADYFARTIAAEIGIDYIRAVISNIYGPGEMSPRLVNTSIRKLLNKEHCSFSPGDQMYDFVYITDAAAMFVAIGDKGISDKSYYIGSQNPRPLKEFLIELKNQVDSSAEIGLGDMEFNGIALKYNEFDIYAVKNDTGVVPKVDFSEGIRLTKEWIEGQK